MLRDILIFDSKDKKPISMLAGEENVFPSGRRK